MRAAAPPARDCESAPLITGAPPAVDAAPEEQTKKVPWRFTTRQWAVWFILMFIYSYTVPDLIRPYIRRLLGTHPRITYPGEHIPWTDCGTVAGRSLECANLTVPMDHFNASNNLPGDKSFTIPLVRLRSPNPTPATRNLLLNPGGPGGSGTGIVHRRGGQIAAVVGDGFHLVGFDPRGVNQSLPRASCYPSDDARRALSAVRAKKAVEDSGELWAWTEGFVRACADTMGEHGRYINTPQTAADMNAILDALGQEGLYYWGLSYGTILGQTYATMFPERAERVIVDGVAGQVDWYESLLDAEMMTDTDRVLEGFVDECVEAGEADCALAGLAGSKEELLELVVSGIAKLKDEPIGVYVNNTVHGVLDYWAVWHNGVFPALYKPASWRDLATNLASLLQGNATEAFLAYGREESWGSLGDALKFVALNDGTSGSAKWPADRLELLDQLLPFFNLSLFADTELDYYFSKQAWTVPHTHTFVPKEKVKTAHPLLLLSTTYDPVCPLVSAKGANEVFEGSRIVEVKGYGHCTISLPSLCVAHHVRNFLYDGKLPDEHVQCEADGKPYFSTPEQTTASVKTLFQTLGTEDRWIWHAQQELAQDSWLGPWRR
ncbi:Alpha/Beta hydrolase protein [Chaetomium fimeti]|uniref:Alpha/Beta hydrolase protein n=1 Tax=Chaetomium fimeti TaxID=1854472 RepID=A0AAE0HB48_9PEZI|nr:Alpha/Beta hydrolase protein [Chaetomium fimeti]